MRPIAIASPKVRIPEGIRFEYKSLPVGRKLRPPIEALFGSEKDGRTLAMCIVLKVQSKKAVFEGHMLIHELIPFWRNRRRPSDHADTCNRPRCSSGSGHAPESAETSTRGREHDLATVRSPGERPQYPGFVEGEPLGRSARDWHHVNIRYYARNDPTDESHGRTVGREGRSSIVLLT